MPENNISKKILPVPTGKSNKDGAFFGRPVVLGINTFVLLALLFSLLIYQRYELVKESNRKKAYAILNQAKERIQETLSHSLSAAKTMALFIDKNGTVNAFDSIAAQIFETGYEFDALQLVPNGVIKYVYPLKGNEILLGYDILKDTSRNAEAFKAIKKRELFFAGPFNLRQGSIGVVGRLPVYRNNNFWGFSAVVIKMSTLFKVAGMDSAGNNGYYFQLSKINPNTKKEEFFLPAYRTNTWDQSISVMVPNGEWKLAVAIPATSRSFIDIILLSVMGFLFSIFGGLFIYRIAAQPKKLHELVNNRTNQLEASENKYRSLIERVSDAFVAIDNNWIYTFVNNRAGEIFGKDPQSLIGKNVWEAFPEGIDQPHYHAFKRAMATQDYQYLEEFYPAYNKWFENNIYPSKDGLTVFFKDVTDIKLVTNALRDNEEKYRSLIEQASDGIVITDLEGSILEVNKSIKTILGYSEEELIGYRVTDFMPKEDIEINPLRIHELMQGKSLLYERRLVKKDGTFIDVEINSKMASSHTLIGFIRDISERKKYESELVYKSTLLEGVSDAITSLDMNRRIVSWNNACVELYGFTAAEALGKRIPELVHFEYPGTTNEAVFKQVFNKGSWKGEFNFIHPKTKTKTYLLSSINLLENKQKEISGFIITSKNIGDRRKAEEALKISNERFELIGKATNDAVWEWNLETNELWGNEVHQQMYGLTLADPVPDDVAWRKRLHPDDLVRMTAIVKDALESDRTSFEAEYRLYTENKGWINVLGSTYIDRNSEGKAFRMLGNMTDITERIKAEQLIKVNEERLRLSLEAANQGLYDLNIQTGEAIVNEQYASMLGYDPATFVETNAFWVERLHPDDKETTFNAYNNYIKGITKTYEIEFRQRTKDNDWKWILSMGKIVEYDIDGKPLRMLGTHTDITERKKASEDLYQSEQKYRLLFYNNPLPMWMTTIPDLDIIDVNDSAIKQYGYSRAEFLKLNAKDLRPAEDVAHFVSEVAKMKPGINNTRSWRHKKKDGTIIHVEIYSHEIFYEGRQVWLGLSHDVTDQYIAKEMLQKSYEDIRQLASNLQSIREDERTNIAREIHDELGQQLTGLKMDLHWLSRKIINADDAVIYKMKESIELINATIASVRKISTDLRPSILDDLGLLAALEWQGEEFEKRSGTVVKFINKAGDITVQPLAATGIFRIYQELLTNIARHANATMVRAILHTDDNMLYFTINDNGIGFDLETIKSKKTLGLLGIKERTLLLGGSYEFKSKPGEGTTTTITIPLIVLKN